MVAILPWGDVIEDFLDGIGLDLEAFLEEMSGGWLFGYVESLERAGVRSVIVCTSSTTTEVTERRHAPTGASVWLLPAGHALRRSRRGGRGRFARAAAPWLATNPFHLASVLRRERATAVLCQEYTEARFSTCVAVARAIGIAAFATFQGGEEPPTAAERWTRSLTLRGAKGFVVGSAREADRLHARWGIPEHRIHPVPNPLSLAEWPVGERADARTALDIPQDSAVVAWYGRVEVHRKGVDVLLDAWDLVADRPGPHHLLLVGDGPDAASVHERVDGRSDIRWLDAYVLDRTPIHRNLAAADVAVLPSRHEGFPVALLEMMASGRAVVAADAPGVRDVAPGGEADGCIVVPTGDVTALHTAVAELLDDGARRAAMEQAARRRIEEAFSYEAVGRRLASIVT